MKNEKEMLVISKEEFTDAVTKTVDKLMSHDGLTGGAKSTVMMISILFGAELTSTLFDNETEKENENV